MDFSKVMVLVTGDTSDETAVEHAADLVREGRGRLIIVYVIVVDRSLPVDAEVSQRVQEGELALQSAERTARIPRGAIDTQLLQAREIGPAVVHEAVVRDVDALVLGTSYPEHLGAFSLGSDIPYILERTPCHVILLREPRVEAQHRDTAFQDTRSASRIG